MYEYQIAFPQSYPEHHIPHWHIVAAPAGRLALGGQEIKTEISPPHKMIEAFSYGLTDTEAVAHYAGIPPEELVTVRDAAMSKYNAVTMPQTVYWALYLGDIRYKQQAGSKDVRLTPNIKKAAEALKAGGGSMSEIASLMEADEMTARTACADLSDLTRANRNMSLAMRRLFELGAERPEIDLPTGKELAAFTVRGRSYAPVLNKVQTTAVANLSAGLDSSESAALHEDETTSDSVKGRLRAVRGKYGADGAGLVCAAAVLGHIPFGEDPNTPLLTLAESRVFYLLSLGYANALIGKKLYIDKMTVKTHVRNIFKKMDAKSRGHSVLRGFATGLLVRRPDSKRPILPRQPEA